MNNPVFFSLAAVLAMLMVALALVWPQGLGARSPKPFGHALAPVPVTAPPLRPATRDPL